nr:MAG TPA: hypothetical protein [Caudoviricetes sp.]
MPSCDPKGYLLAIPFFIVSVSILAIIYNVYLLITLQR